MESRKKGSLFAWILVFAIPLALVINYGLQFSPQAARALTVAHYFGFFTVQTNLLTALWALSNVLGWSVSANPYLRTWLMVYLTVTALVFLGVLLPGQSYPDPWSWGIDLFLHPGVWALFSWDYFFRSRPGPMKFRYQPLVLVFPAAYWVLTLTQRPTWYPYAFLDPAQNPFLIVTIVVAGPALTAMAWGFAALSARNPWGAGP